MNPITLPVQACADGLRAVVGSKSDAEGQFRTVSMLSLRRSSHTSRRWHAPCISSLVEVNVIELERAMGIMTDVFPTDRMFLRHDLLIEIGRVDMALDEIRIREKAVQPELICSLEKRRTTLNDALVRLTA